MLVFRRSSCYASSRYFTQTVPVKRPSVEMRASSSSVDFNHFGQRHLRLNLYVCLPVEDEHVALDLP